MDINIYVHKVVGMGWAVAETALTVTVGSVARHPVPAKKAIARVRKKRLTISSEFCYKMADSRPFYATKRAGISGCMSETFGAQNKDKCSPCGD